MIVPADRQYLSEPDVAALRVGDRHHIDSGMGGSFEVEFVAHEGRQFVFDVVSDGWETMGPLSFEFDQVRQSVYDLVPAKDYRF